MFADFDVTQVETTAATWMTDSAESVVVRSINWAGTRFDAIAVPDNEEIRRRASLCIDAIIDYRTLETLSALPAGVEVPWQLLDPIVAGYLSVMPKSLVSKSKEGVSSLLASPFRRLILIKWTRDLRSVGSFPQLGQHVPAIIVVKRSPRRLDEAISKAERWGVGLGVPNDVGAELVTSPSEPQRRGITRTRIGEVVFARWLAQGAVTLENRSHDLSCFDGG